MVPTDEVKQSVSEEHRQLESHIRSACLRLPPSGRNADDHVTEEASSAIAERAFALRECEYVGRTVLAAIDPVENLDLIVTRQKDRQLRVRHLKRIEHGARPTREIGAHDPGVRTPLDDQANHGRDCGGAFARAPAARAV